MLTTTLNKILDANPCTRGWCKLTGQHTKRKDWVGSDDKITIAHILDNNGFEDALWAVTNATDNANYNAWCRHLIKKYYNVVIEQSSGDYFSARKDVIVHITLDYNGSDYPFAESVMMTELVKYLKGDNNNNTK